MTEDITAERMKELEEFVSDLFAIYFGGVERYNLTDEEFAIIAGGAIGQIAAENDIKNGNGAASRIVFVALRIMLSYTGRDVLSQMLRDRLSAALGEQVE